MNTDISGRVNNTTLPKHKSLLPLFEALINSFHAVSERTKMGGEIHITILRHPVEESLFGEEQSGPIKSISITDNGVGFNSRNFDSFNTADSAYKRSVGGKGIGRFVWLKAFDHVEIVSNYEEGGQWHKRSIRFSASVEGIETSLVEGMEGLFETTVTLINMKVGYALGCPKHVLTISDKIVEHALYYLLRPNAPLIVVSDERESCRVNWELVNRVKQLVPKSRFEINGQQFDVDFVKLFRSNEGKNALHYCADQREVITERLSTMVPDLNSKLKDEQGNEYVYHVYVSSPYLNSIANAERTTLSFAAEEGLFGEVTQSQLSQQLEPIISSRVSPDLAEVRKEKRRKIESFTSVNPQFRHLLHEQFEQRLDKIPANAGPKKLESELSKIKYEIQREVRTEVNDLLSGSLDSAKEEYAEKYTSIVNAVNDITTSSLAEYVVHRKVILEILEKRLGQRDGLKYQLEDAIHEVIFPLRSDSNHIEFGKQNLWIIDERLTYHRFLASDIPLNQIEPLNNDSRLRPDIVIFDQPFAFSESQEMPFSSVVLVEFKRPMRNDYDDEENPIVQIYEYIDKLKSDKALDANGRPIVITKHTQFFCYIICDVTDKLRKYLRQNSFHETSDRLGYFLHNPHYGWIELIPFTKLLQDAKKRNRSLFEMLSIL